MLNFNPHFWYWLADDGRIFSSASSAFITEKDATYTEWKAAGGNPSRWPIDDAGAQTNASLQAVVGKYHIYADLAAYAAAKRYLIETGGFTFKSHPISTDRDSQSKIGNIALAANILGSSFSTEWKCADGTFFTLNHDDAIAMATDVMAFVSACFATENAVDSAISAGSITSIAEIDAASWPKAS